MPHSAVLYLGNDSAVCMCKSRASGIDRFKTVSARSQETVCKVKTTKKNVNQLVAEVRNYLLLICSSRSYIYLSPTYSLAGCTLYLSLILPAVNRDFKNSSRLVGKLVPPTLVSKPILF